MTGRWKGVIISESLEEPSLLNGFDVYKACISKRDQPIDDRGHSGRWHMYWVRSTDKKIEALSSQITDRWYAHFWKGQRLVAVFRGKKFEFKSRDKLTWKEAVEYGKSVGIPEEQLDFPTN